MRVLAAAAVALALAASASAHHTCDRTPPVFVDVAGQAYVFVEEVYGVLPSHGYFFEMFVYLESNGKAGLQRGGCGGWIDSGPECTIGSPHDEPCQTTTNPDSQL